MKKLLLSIILLFSLLSVSATIIPIGSGSGGITYTTATSNDTLGIRPGTYNSAINLGSQTHVAIIPYGGNVTFTGAASRTYTNMNDVNFTSYGGYIFKDSSLSGDGFYIYGSGNANLFFNGIKGTNSYNSATAFLDCSSGQGDYVYYNGTVASLKLYNAKITNCSFTGCNMIFMGDYNPPSALRNFVDSLVITNDTVTNTATNGWNIGGNITRLYVGHDLIDYTGLNTADYDVGFAYFDGWGNFYDNIMKGGRGWLARQFLYSLSSNPVQTAYMYNNLKTNSIKYGMFDLRNDATSWNLTYCTHANFKVFNNTIGNCQDSAFITPVVLVYQMDSGAVGSADNNFGFNLQFTSGGSLITSFDNWTYDTASNIYTQNGALGYIKDTTTTYMPTSTSYLNNHGISAPLATPDLYGYTGSGNRIGAIYYNPGGSNTPPSFGQGTKSNIQLPLDSIRIGNVATQGTCRISSYGWTQVSGPSTATISTPSADSSWFKNLVAGTYILQLKVQDTCSLAATVNDTIIVKAANTPPTFGQGTKNSITLPLDSVRTGNVATAGSCRVSTYAWSQVSGPSTATISTPSADSSWFKNLVAGTYIFQLRATDTCSGFAIVNDTVIVHSTNTPPTFGHGTKNTITLPLDSVRTGNVATAGSCRISTYAWSLMSGPASATISTPSADSSWLKNLVAGTYIFQLRATDTCSQYATVNDTVIVNPGANTPPSFSHGSNSTISLPLDSIRIGNVATAGTCRVSSYAWTQLSGPSTATIVSPSSDSSWFKNLIAGSYVFQLEATDTCSRTATVYDTINVVNNDTVTNTRNSTTFKLWPNPAYSILYLSMTGNVHGNVFVKIFNTMGKIVIVKQGFKSTNTYELTFNIASLQDGTYYVQTNIAGGKVLVTQTFLLMR